MLNESYTENPVPVAGLPNTSATKQYVFLRNKKEKICTKEKRESGEKDKEKEGWSNNASINYMDQRNRRSKRATL